MQNRHKNRKQYFNEQVFTTNKFVIPYLNQFVKTKKTTVLEIGCGEGGNLLPFLNIDCSVHGVDPAQDKINNANIFLKKYIDNKQCKLYCDNVFEVELKEKFDIIFLRDVIEHINDHIGVLRLAKELLNENGVILVIFPPWQNPFGGHQQMLSSILSKVPFIHLLNDKTYIMLMKLFRERDVDIESLIDLNNSKITIEEILNLSKSLDLKIIDLLPYFINPNYLVKFGLKPRILPPLLARIPIIRNYLSTTCYTILGRK